MFDLIICHLCFRKKVNAPTLAATSRNLPNINELTTGEQLNKMYGRHEKKITSTKNKFEIEDKRRLFTPPPIETHPKNMEQALSKTPIGQVVLDKFGNFRLASNEKSTEPATSTVRLSRSRSRRKYSSNSRSRSRSVKRRNRSRSHDRRRYTHRSYRSRSVSRPNSYSRSRSVSVERHRSRYRGRSNYDRGTYYKPRFGSARFNVRGNRGGFRDSRDYRGRGRDNWHRSSWSNRGGTTSSNRYCRNDSRDRRTDRRSKSLGSDNGRKGSVERNNMLKIKSPFQSLKSTEIEDWDEKEVVNKEEILIDVAKPNEI